MPRHRSAATRRRVPAFLSETLERRELLASASASAPGTSPGPSAPADTSGFVPMFNGVNTAGWFNPYHWGSAVARDGQILLSSPKNFFLMSRATYSDFIIQADVLIPPGGNSGLQFRSQYGPNFVRGYQADMDTADRNWAGGLYYQSRGWLARPAHRAPVVPGRWNHYMVEAVGHHIQIWVNGTLTIDTYRTIASSGHIGLQDHGSAGTYHFRNVAIEVLP